MNTILHQDSEVAYILGLEAKLQKHDKSKPMSREEVKAALIQVRQMSDRINALMTPSVPF